MGAARAPREAMNRQRSVAVAVGVLFLVSNATFLLGSVVFVEPVLDDPDTLAAIADSRTELVLGVLLEIANAVAYVGLAALMFTVLRRRFEAMAVGYVGFRAIEFVMQVLAGLAPLALLSLGEAVAAGDIPDGASLDASAALLLAQRDWAFQMISITFGVGALVFNTMLFRSRLVPAFISIWGLLGAAAVLLTAILDMLEITGLDFLGVVMLANELFLGGWLIAVGFNRAAILSAPSQPDRGA